MKIALWLIVLFAAGTAVAEQLTVDRSVPLTIYNHRAGLQLKHQIKLQKLCRIKADEAEQIALKVCQAQEILHRTLKHKGQLLFYRIATEKCTVAINALDGAVISNMFVHKTDKEGRKQ